MSHQARRCRTRRPSGGVSRRHRRVARLGRRAAVRHVASAGVGRRGVPDDSRLRSAHWQLGGAGGVGGPGLARRCGVPRSRERLAWRCRPGLCSGRRKDESAADSPHRASGNRPQRPRGPTDCWVGLCRRTVDEHVDIDAGRSAERPHRRRRPTPAWCRSPSTGLHCFRCTAFRCTALRCSTADCDADVHRLGGNRHRRHPSRLG